MVVVKGTGRLGEYYAAVLIADPDGLPTGLLFVLMSFLMLYLFPQAGMHRKVLIRSCL
jgi:hypothetical protein